jgi:hypothetical protein
MEENSDQSGRDHARAAHAAKAKRSETAPGD